ncbi:MAG: prepilin peptidase [Amaricoccus sp.]
MQLAISVVAVVLFATAAVTDARHRRISNRLSVGLALLGLVRLALAVAAGAGAWSVAGDLAAALGVFALGALAFHLRLLGGGDVKLLAAGALWLGTGELGAFLTATVLAGGLLAIGFVAWQRVLPGWHHRAGTVSLPYAIAIATGGILATAAALMA